MQSFEMVEELMEVRTAARLRLDQRRPDLRPAEADSRRASPAPCDRSASCDLTGSRSIPTLICPSGSSRSVASSTPICRARRSASRCSAMRSAAFLSREYCYIGMDHFATAARPARGGEARRAAASQFPGLQHAARLRPGGAGRVGDRSHRRGVLPEREDASRVLRVARQGTAAGRSRLLADPRRRGPARRDHAADVPGTPRIRARSNARTESAWSTISPRNSRRCAGWRSRGSSLSRRSAIQVTAAGWFLVRAIAMVFDHHLQVAKERRGFSRVV